MDRSSGQLTQSLNLDDWIIEVVKVSETHLEGVRVNDIQKFKYGRIIFTNLLPLVMRFGFYPSSSLTFSPRFSLSSVRPGWNNGCHSNERLHLSSSN